MKLKISRTNAALTLGIIGTALGAFTGNNGCGGGNGILGGLFGGNNGNCLAEKQNLISDAYLQRQLDTKITGELKYAYNNLCAPVPNISPLYCSPFTTYGSGTTWTGCCNGSGNCQGQ